MVLKILDRFYADNKVIYKDGWLGIRNFIKHQKSDKKNDNITIGIKHQLEKVPKEIKEWCIKPLEDPSRPSNYTNININTNINDNTNINLKKNTPEKAECFTYDTKVSKYKGNSTIKTWCRLFKPMCDDDDKFCMSYYNLLYNGLVREFKAKGLDPKSRAFYGAWRNKVRQMLNDPDSEIFKKLKERYNEMPSWLEEDE